MNHFELSYTLLTVISVDLLATAGDITLSWTSPVFPKLFSNDTSINPLGRPITDNEDAMIGSLLTLGAMVGPLPFSIIAENFGRKIALLSIAVPHIVSYITMALSRDVYLYYFGRFLGGLAVGGGYTVLPTYIAEISQDSNRGTMTQTLNVFWAIGNFLPYAIGPFISIKYFNLIACCFPILFFLSFFFIGPETPYYLVKINKMKEAEECLMLLRSTDQKGVQKELEHIEAGLAKEEKGRFIDIFKKRELRRAYIICFVLIIAQEMSGFCAITFYLQPIFEASGTVIPSHISALIVGIAMLVSSFFAPIFIESTGRKRLTIYSCFGMFLSLTMLGTFFHLQALSNLNSSSIFWLPIVSLIFYIFSFNLGISSIPWTLCSELFPSNFKQASSSSICFVCWLSSFLITKFFNDMNYGMGISGTFWIFAGICLLATIFSMVWVPETKGKSFIEIQNMLRGTGSKITELDLQDT